MKKSINIFILIAMLSAYSVAAQRIFVESGINSTSFVRFKDNGYVKPVNDYTAKPTKRSYGLGVLLNVFKEGNRLCASSDYKVQLGVNYSTHQINNGVRVGNTDIPIDYSLDFFTLNAGVHIPLYKVSDFKFHGHFNLSNSWLTAGTRVVQENTIDLKTDPEFYQSYFNSHFGVDVEYPISKTTGIYINYDKKRSFSNNRGFEESYPISVHTVNLGIRIGGKQFDQ